MRLDNGGGRLNDTLAKASAPGASSVAGPVILVTAAVVGVPLAYGVSLADSLLYLGYEACYVAIPGWLVYRALSQQPGGWLRQLALGWGLGYTLEVLAFILTAAAGVRYLDIAYPLIVGLPAAWTLRRKQISKPLGDDIPIHLRWIIGGICVVAAIYIAPVYFYSAPLPGHFPVHYGYDLPWHLSLASDAKHHWPIGDPNVSGLSMPYHFFVHVHLASASNVTGLTLPLVFFRLFLLPLIVLAVLQLVVAGQSLARSARVGVIAAGLCLLIGQIDFVRSSLVLFRPFLGLFLTHVISSPSIPFGLVMLLPLLILIGEAVSDTGGGNRFGQWILILLFLVGASDAKIIILPMILLSLSIYGAGHLIRRRRIPGNVLIAAGLTGLVFGSIFLIQYRGHSSGVSVDPSLITRFFTNQPAPFLVKSYATKVLPSFPGSSMFISVATNAFGAFGLLGVQLIGMAWLFRFTGVQLSKSQLWLLSFFGSGLIVVLLASSASAGTGNVSYFLDYAIIAGSILAAEGLHRSWNAFPRFLRVLGGKKIAVLALIAGGLLSASMTLSSQFVSTTSTLVVGRTYLVTYLAVAIGIGALVAIGSLWSKVGRSVAFLVATGLILVAGLLYEPLLLVDRPSRPPATRVGRRITPQLYNAMTWIRDHTPGNTVVAVNNAEALDFGYAAFTERRMFLGGWGYSLPSRDAGYAEISPRFIMGQAGSAGANLFARRVRLNNRVFRDSDRRASHVLMSEFGVRYLLVDELNGFAADLTALYRVARPVYRASGVVVLKLE